MRIFLESLRFMFIFFLLTTVLGAMAHLLLSSIGMSADKYSWIGMIVALIVTFVLCNKWGWGKIFNKNLLSSRSLSHTIAHK